ERRVFALEGPEEFEKGLDLLGVEAGTDVAPVAQLTSAFAREHERSETLGAAPFTARISRDEEFLAPMGLHLDPVASALSLAVLRARLLRHQPFEAARTVRVARRSAVLEGLGETNGLVALVEQLRPPGLPEVECAVHDRVTVHLE